MVSLVWQVQMRRDHALHMEQQALREEEADQDDLDDYQPLGGGWVGGCGVGGVLSGCGYLYLSAECPSSCSYSCSLLTLFNSSGLNLI